VSERSDRTMSAMSEWSVPDPELLVEAIRTPDFEVLTRADVDVNTAITWDRGLSRRARLLVPVDVQAYVVPEGGTEASVVVAGLPGDPQPFAPGQVRPRGVHLHWAMPDGLLRGRQSATEAELELPPLPDRWVVVRILLPVGRERPLVRGWVIDATTKVVTPLATFTGTPGPPADAGDRLERLDGAFGGGLLWTASYQASGGRFGFHDPLDDLGALADLAPDGFHGDSASYTVAGWWSTASQDPLDGTTAPAEVDDRLAELGWYVDHEGRDELWQTDVVRAEAVRSGTGLPSDEQARNARLAFEAAGATAPVPLDLSVANPIGAFSEVVVGPARLSYLSMLHGSVLGVPLGSLPGADARPPGAGVQVSVGIDVDDVAAALGAPALGADPARRDLAERLVAAFTGGLLERLATPDGLLDLAQREHDDGFWPLAGPPLPTARPDRLRVEGSEAVSPSTVGRKGRGALADRPAVVDRRSKGFTGTPVKGSRARGPTKAGLVFMTADDLRSEQRRDVTSPPEPQRKAEHAASAAAERREVVRPAPRVFRPQAPMIGLRNVKPSLRHNGDGLHDDTGRLRCRYPSEVGDAYEGVLQGADLIPTLGSGAIPGEVLMVVREVLLLDPYAERWHSEAAAGGDATLAGLAHVRLSAELARMYGADASYDGAGTAFLAAAGPSPLAPGDAWSAVPTPDERLLQLQAAAEAARFSTWNGTTPSPVAITTWSQPWVPLWLEWRVRVLGDRTLDGWRLGQLDLERAGDDRSEAIDRELLGRSPISRGVGTALHEGIKAWLDAENKRDRARDSTISDADESALATLGGLLAPVDLVSATLDGLREQLLGIPYVGQIERGEPGTDGEPLPIAAELPITFFGGRMDLRELRVVDAFGRTLDVPIDATRTTTTLEDPDDPTSITLRPRLQHTARWLFRFIDPGHALDADPLDAREAFVDQVDPALGVNPVAGFLLPDHIDEALELFTTDGEPIGQLGHDGLTGAVDWEVAPGRRLPPDAAPLADLAGQHQLMGLMASGVVLADMRARNLDAAPTDSALTALLRAVDTTMWTVDTLASTGTPSIAGLIGRPIAVVRATLRLDAPDDVDELDITHPGGPDARRREFDRLRELRFPVRLGDLHRTDDALLGFFVDDDYGRLHVVDRVVAAQARDIGRHRGHVGLLGATDPPPVVPLDHPYIDAEDELWVRAGQTVRLTLLMLPAGRVHLTSGILPRKALALGDQWTTPGLERIVPSVRVGPLLIDPADVRLPKIHVLGETQSFIRRTGPLTWREDPIVAATQAALLPRLPHEVQEGWVRVTPEDEASPDG
jgi:hypothetical protein